MVMEYNDVGDKFSETLLSPSSSDGVIPLEALSLYYLLALKNLMKYLNHVNCFNAGVGYNTMKSKSN